MAALPRMVAVGVSVCVPSVVKLTVTVSPTLAWVGVALLLAMPTAVRAGAVLSSVNVLLLVPVGVDRLPDFS